MADVRTSTSAKLKVCLLGDEAVGKTSTVRRYLLNQFSPDYMRTIGTLVSKKSVDLQLHGRSLTADLILWDIMGQKNFLDLLREAYFYKASGLIAVADLSRPETIQALGEWIQGALEATGPVPIQVLGNKVDLLDDLTEVERAIQQLCRTYRAEYLFTSAKTGHNVERAFEALAGGILGSRPDIALPAPVDHD